MGIYHNINRYVGMLAPPIHKWSLSAIIIKEKEDYR